MRTLSGSPASNYGHNPRFYVDIKWAGDWVRYSTDNNAKSISAYAEKQGSLGVAASVSMTVIDNDLSIREIMKTIDLHKRPARIYIEMDFADPVLLLEGETEGPISYNWEQRILQVSVGNIINFYHVGFSPESGQFAGLSQEFVGRPWPICFGSPLFVPLTKTAATISSRVSGTLGVQDYTLPAKIRYLQYIASSIENSYNRHAALLTQMQSLLPDLAATRTNYLNSIIEYDTAKQDAESKRLVVEYAQKMVNNYLRLYEAALPADEQTMLDQLTEQRTVLENVRAELQVLVDSVKGLELTQKGILTDVKLARYLFSVIDKLRDHLKKIRRRYTEVIDRQILASQAKTQQEAVYGQPVLLDNGFNFPQNTPTTIATDDNALMVGTISGNILTNVTPIPTYNNLSISVDGNINSNQFYLNSDENLEGQYCLIDSGYIIRIISQTGNLCTYQERYEKETLNRTKSYRIALQTALSNGLSEDLNFLLGGGESNAQLEYIANTVPTQISRNAWNILQGDGADTQILKVGVDLTGSFSLLYQGQTTPTIDLSTLTSTTLFNAVRSLPLFDNMQNAVDKIEVRAMDNEDDSKVFEIEFKFDEWEDEDPFPRLMLPFSVNVNQVAGEGLIGMYRKTTGAREYTLETIDRMIDKAVDDALRGDELNDVKKKIQQAQTALQYTTDPVSQQELQTLLTENMTAYFDILREVLTDSNVLARAVRLISEDEEKTILDLETMIYIDWYRKVFPRPEAIEVETLVIPNTSFTRLVQTSPIFLPQWSANVTDDNLFDFIEKLPTVQSWQLRSSGTIHLAQSFQERYIANLLPSTIHAVYGFYNGKLTPIPSNMYTVYSSVSNGPYTTTEIAFGKLPTNFDSDAFYVVLTSSVGPNPVDIIQWIIENYTDHTVDTTTFTAVKALVTKYPCHFFFTGTQDALQLIQAIAYEARCELWMKNKKAYIRYEPSDPPSVKTIDDSDVLEDSLTLSYSDTTNIATKFVGTWRPSGIEDTRNIVVRLNVAKYGEIESAKQYISLNNADLVYKSVTFWANRDANTWTYLSFRLDLLHIDLEVNDVVTLDLPILDSPSKAKIIAITIDPDACEIEVTCWLPIKSGENSLYTFAWPAAITDTFPTAQMVEEGNAGHPVNIQVPTGNPWDGLNLDLKPFDTGRNEISDNNDSTPSNPANSFSTVASLIPSNLEDVVEVEEEEIEDLQIEYPSILPALDLELDIEIQPGMVAMGRIVGGTPEAVADGNLPEGEDADPDFSPTIRRWQVELMNGNKIWAQFPDHHPDDKLPLNYPCMVTFSTTLNDYILSVPIEPPINLQELEDEGAI